MVLTITEMGYEVTVFVPETSVAAGVKTPMF